jgi:hypothetical protein
MTALALVLLAAAGLLAWLLLRPNRAEVDPELRIESWDVVADGQHHSNTDMVFWRGAFWLVHASSPFHMGTPRCRLVVRRCADPEPGPESRFDVVAELRIPGSDIRDPKLLPVGSELFLYALGNPGFFAVPKGTVLARSADGERWSEFAPVGPEGWLFWRPKRAPAAADAEEALYVPAYWKAHGESVLLRSTDGVDWKQVARIHRGEGNDETAIEWLPGPGGEPGPRLLATARLEVTPDTLLGNDRASTLLAFADPPYEAFPEARKVRSRVTRLDGPVLFADRGRVFAVGRAQPGARGGLTRLGGVFSRKRTALFWIDPGREGVAGRGGGPRLVWLSDLPSAGDTSYAGVVCRGDALYVDYYTSPIRRDWPWIVGMFLRSDIRMARLPLAALHASADGAEAASA